VMLIYLDNALTEMVEERRRAERPLTEQDFYAAIMEGAVERVRPKMMTVSTIMAGLLPILRSTGTGLSRQVHDSIKPPWRLRPAPSIKLP
jgi:Cu(I)/Ag(I) efflux system membrane protein CusA/SilA